MPTASSPAAMRASGSNQTTHGRASPEPSSCRTQSRTCGTRGSPGSGHPRRPCQRREAGSFISGFSAGSSGPVSRHAGQRRNRFTSGHSFATRELEFQGSVSYSADGYEETFATNCLGHFLLVELLIDRVADQGRIVFTASGTHDPDTMDGKMVGTAVEPDAQALAREGKNGAKAISGGKRYSTSKLCTVLYAYELDRRLRAGHSSIASIAFDPGLIPETGLVRTSPKPVQWLVRRSAMKWLFKRLGVTMGSLGFSGASLARIVADPSFADGSGNTFSRTTDYWLRYDPRRSLTTESAPPNCGTIQSFWLNCSRTRSPQSSNDHSRTADCSGIGLTRRWR